MRRVVLLETGCGGSLVMDSDLCMTFSVALLDARSEICKDAFLKEDRTLF